MGLVKSISDYIDALIHARAQRDALTAARHRAFIAPRLFAGFITLAMFPLYVALRGVPGTLEVLIFAWPVAPISIAYFLSRTGQYEVAQSVSALALTGFGTLIATFTGKIESFAAVWLVISPLEAAFCASRRVTAVASALAFGAILALLWLAGAHMLPVSQSAYVPAALATTSAAIYATALAFGSQSLMRTSFRLRNAAADRHRLLTGIISDAITRHDRNGAVLFASSAAEPLFGTHARELIGQGLFDRVHVADRPAYLTTLADTAVFGHDRQAEFRVRRETADRARAAEQYVWVEMRCQPIDRAAGTSGRQDREVIAVMRDITERKQQEQAIANLRNEIETATEAHSNLLALMRREQIQTIGRASGNPDQKVKKSA